MTSFICYARHYITIKKCSLCDLYSFGVMKRERNKIEPKWNKQNKTKHNATPKLETEFLILYFFFLHIYICIWKIATRNDIHKSPGQAIVFCAWYCRERVRERDRRREIETEFEPKTTMKSLHDQLWLKPPMIIIMSTDCANMNKLM